MSTAGRLAVYTVATVAAWLLVVAVAVAAVRLGHAVAHVVEALRSGVVCLGVVCVVWPIR